MLLLQKILIGTATLITFAGLSIAAPAKAKPALEQITTKSGLSPLRDPAGVLSSRLSKDQEYKKKFADPEYYSYYLGENGKWVKGSPQQVINTAELAKFEAQLEKQNAVGYKYQELYGKWDPKLKKFADQDSVLAKLRSDGDAIKTRKLEEAVSYMKDGGEDLVNKLYEMIRLRDYGAWQRAIIVWLKSIFGYSEEAKAMREKAWEQYKENNPDDIPIPAEKAPPEVEEEKKGGTEIKDEQHEAQDSQIRKPDEKKEEVKTKDSKPAEAMHPDEDNSDKVKSGEKKGDNNPHDEGETDVHKNESDMGDSKASKGSTSDAGSSGSAGTKLPPDEEYESVMKDIEGDPIKYKYPTDELKNLFDAPASAAKETLEKYGLNVDAVLDAQKFQQASAKLHSILTSLASYNNVKEKLSDKDLDRVEELIHEAEEAGKEAESAHGLIDTDQSIWRMAAGGNPQVLELVERKFPGAKEFLQELQSRRAFAEASGAADEDVGSWLSYKKVDPAELLHF